MRLVGRRVAGPRRQVWRLKKLWRSECGEMCLVIPAVRHSRRTMRVAAWRSIR